MEDLPISTIEEVGTLDLNKMLNQGWKIVDSRVDEDANHIKQARFIIQKSPELT